MALPLRTAPRISAAQFIAVLEKYGSPCAPIGQECYEIVTSSGLDPAIALAIFARESVFGTQGTTVETRNWGNVRTAYRPERAVGTHPKNFSIFATWQDGLLDWCERINERYIDERGLDTIDKVLPVYAPADYGNDVQGYIEQVIKLVAQWVEEDRKRQPAQKAQTASKAGPGLREELLQVTFANAGATYRPDTPLHQFVLSEARAGRPLGNPIGEMQQIKIDGQDYVIQVFALDTIYAPVQEQGKVYRLSELLKT